jgi:PAS domain S-box-containing protein
MSYKILVSDDNGETISQLSELLKDDIDGLQIIPIRKEEIYSKALELNPNIILVFPKTLVRVGIESIISLKQNKSTHNIPVLIISEYSPVINLDRIFEYGIVDIIRKPFTKDEVLLRFDAAINRSEFQHDIYIEHELLRELSIVAKRSANSVIVISFDGIIEWVNEGFEKMYGYTYSEFKEKFEENIFDPKSNPKLFDAIQKCKEGYESVVYENKWTTNYETPIWIQTTLTPIYNEQNEIIKFVAIESDVSALKEVEERLEAKNESLLSLAESLEKTNQLLEEQKLKSDELLLNILPVEIANQLKKKGSARSKQYKMVSILFTDFKDFSKLAGIIPSQDLITELNIYFQKFDEIIEGHFIEKIKTIGDAYMCAGGLPLTNKSNPIDITIAGLKIQKFIKEYAEIKRANNQEAWVLRVGIHTGEVIAGVVGKKKFAYDIWGDAVNKAARMEQSGEVGRVNVSGDTYEFIKDYFECTYRGKIEVKNNVDLDMYFVNRLKPEFSDDAEGTEPNAEFLKILAKY